MKDLESDSYNNKTDMKEKVNGLVRLHETMQQLKTESYSKQIQGLVPDEWPRMYCSECFNVFEYLANFA